MTQIPETRNGPGWVIMRHPDLPGQYAEATEEAVDVVWEPKGWVRVTDEDRSRSLSGLRKTALVAEAERRGIDTSGTADDLRARLTDTKEA